LFLDGRDLDAPRIGLGFDHAQRFLFRKQHVVGRPDAGRVFLDRDAGRRVVIDAFFV
jgi:hypothetical protein